MQYQGPDYSFLGSERTDEFGSESRFETTIEKFEDDGSTARPPGRSFSAIFHVLVDTDTGDFKFDNTSVMLQDETRTFTDGGSQMTEVRKHLMSENFDHLGGFQVYNGETTQYNANWEEGSVVFSVGSDTPQLTADDGIAYELFKVYYSEEVRSFGESSEIERSYFTSDGSLFFAW